MKKLFDGRKRKPYPVNCPLHPKDVAYPYDAYVFHGTLEAWLMTQSEFIRVKFKSGLAICASCKGDKGERTILRETPEKYAFYEGDFNKPDLRYRDFKYPNYRVENI